MIVIEEIIGNVYKDEELAREQQSHADKGTLERVTITSNESKRSRVRKTTDEKTDIGIVADRPEGLEQGDVLVCNDSQMIVVEFEQEEVLVISFNDININIDAILTMVELGHYIGNKHWDLQVMNNEVYLPVASKKKQQKQSIVEKCPNKVSIRYEHIDPTVFNSGTPSHSHYSNNSSHH